MASNLIEENMAQSSRPGRQGLPPEIAASLARGRHAPEIPKPPRTDDGAITLAGSIIEKWELSSEQDTLQVYQGKADKKGKLTVGMGHLVLPGDNLKEGDTITEAQKKAFQKQDSAKAVQLAKKFAGDKWDTMTDSRRAALISLSFNSGDLTVAAPTAWQAMKDGNDAEVMKHLFSKKDGIVNADGKFVQGLYNRRQDELESYGQE
jgi:GH24 family phage-related lysozyme (muramidase)